MSGNTGSTNNAATELSHLQAAYRELYKQVKDLRAERDRQATEIGRLQSQIRDMQRSLSMMMQSSNRNGNSGRGGPPGFRMGGSKSRKNRKTRKSRKN